MADPTKYGDIVMNTAISIIVGASILAASYVYVNRYQEVGQFGSFTVYKDMISGRLLAAGPGHEIELLRTVGIKFLPLK
ncbi:MAG: hypothetical protein ACOYVJ_02530 [Nitrospirota bacterium]